MTTLLQRDIQTWRDIGGLHTAEEIAHQPAIWRALASILRKEHASLAAFLGDALSNPQQRVILTGAGSSAYVGEIVVDTLNAVWPAHIRAIATTTLLTYVIIGVGFVSAVEYADRPGTRSVAFIEDPFHISYYLCCLGIRRNRAIIAELFDALSAH